MLRDLKNAIRALARARTFTITAVLALALAIDANGAIFALADTLWCRPPGVRDAGTLVRVYATSRSDATVTSPVVAEVAAFTRSHQ